MSHYAYYQGHSPSWGTNNYEFAPPPAPNYIPQASWHGNDYYRAHGGYNAEPSFFDSVWSKVKGFAGSTQGLSRSEAKYWHKRVYGGIVSVNQLMPAELGAAAGYEAIRIWEEHKNIYREPLHENRDMEREGLAGIAVAEASKLWQLAGQGRHGGRETSEIAAATAERIFTHQYDHHHHDRHREQEYEFDGGQYEHGRSHRRRRSSGAYYRPSGGAHYGHSTSSAMAIPISSGHRHHEYEYAPHGHQSGSYGSYGHPGSYPHSGSYGGGGGGYGHSVGSYPHAAPSYGGHSPYGRSAVLPQPAYSSSSGAHLSPYAGSSSLVPMAAGALVPVSQGSHHRARRASFGGGEYVPSTGYSYR